MCLFNFNTNAYIFFGWKLRKVDEQTNETKLYIVYMNLVNLLPCTQNFAHILRMYFVFFFIIRFDVVQQSNRHFKNIHAISSEIWKERESNSVLTIRFIECIWLRCVYISELKIAAVIRVWFIWNILDWTHFKLSLIWCFVSTGI